MPCCFSSVPCCFSSVPCVLQLCAVRVTAGVTCLSPQVPTDVFASECTLEILHLDSNQVSSSPLCTYTALHYTEDIAHFNTLQFTLRILYTSIHHSLHCTTLRILHTSIHYSSHCTSLRILHTTQQFKLRTLLSSMEAVNRHRQLV